MVIKDEFVTAAVTPVSIDSLELETSATLFVMEVVFVFIRVNETPASVAPEHRQKNRVFLSQLFARLRHLKEPRPAVMGQNV